MRPNRPIIKKRYFQTFEAHVQYVRNATDYRADSEKFHYDENVGGNKRGMMSTPVVYLRIKSGRVNRRIENSPCARWVFSGENSRFISGIHVAGDTSTFIGHARFSLSPSVVYKTFRGCGNRGRITEISFESRPVFILPSFFFFSASAFRAEGRLPGLLPSVTLDAVGRIRPGGRSARITNHVRNTF